MGEMVNKVIAGLLTLGWAYKMNGYVSEDEIVKAYRRILQKIKEQ